MSTKNIRRKLHWAWIAPLTLCLAPLGSAQAASVAIDSLTVANVSLTVAIDGDGTYNFSGPIVPPAVLTMGVYQDPIVQLSSGSLTAKVYTTGAFGEPAPSGSVDAALGTIDVDFSSLRASASIPLGSIDVPLWPLINPPSGGTYNGGTGQYSLVWSDTFSGMLNIGGFMSTITGTASVTLSGSVTPVPLPAALWLLGSGLVAIGVSARRRRSDVAATE